MTKHKRSCVWKEYFSPCRQRARTFKAELGDDSSEFKRKLTFKQPIVTRNITMPLQRRPFSYILKHKCQVKENFKKPQQSVSSMLSRFINCYVANIGPIHCTEHITLCVASTHHLDLTFWGSLSLQPTSDLQRKSSPKKRRNIQCCW